MLKVWSKASACAARRTIFCLICSVLTLAWFGLPSGSKFVQAQSASQSKKERPGPRVEFSFIVLGCNRLQHSDWDKSTNPSSANVPQLRQTFADITRLNPIPPFVFFTGDLVLNLAQDDGETLRGQLNAWAQLYRGDTSGIAQQTTLVPLTGNHGLLQEIKSDESKGAKLEVLNPAAFPVWLAWLSSNGFDQFAGNGPTNAAPNLDLLSGDESRLTYSFDVGGVHFIVLNTDSLTTNLNIGWIAYNWIEEDIFKAQKNKDIKSIFVLGHKPIIAPKEAVEPGNAIINPLSFQLASLLNRSSKVKAYLCAHAHLWEARQLGDSNAAWQVIAGNGGSQLEKSWNPPGGPYYGFTLVRLYQNGKVGVVSYGRPVPDPYFADSAQPALAQPEIILNRNHGGGRKPLQMKKTRPPRAL